MKTRVDPLPDDLMVTVCSECKQASCWQGLFMCQGSQWAGTVDLPVSALRRINAEHWHHWDRRKEPR